MKNLVRNLLMFLRLDLTKNLEYDRLTKVILKQILQSNYNCIDIGAHKGEILELLLKYAPQGKHTAFEPIPPYFDNLKQTFITVDVFPYALGNQNGTTTFNYVKNAPAYSGIKQRKYAVNTPEITELTVELKKLDDVIDTNKKIDFIKIDVEGGEFDVLKGSKHILTHSKPYVLFECGLGASEFYALKPEELFHYFEHLGYKLFTLKAFINQKDALSQADFIANYERNKEYYFIASAR